MKIAHTPGPWMIFPGGDIGSASVRRPDTTVIRSGTVKGETIANAMANARLIAAAPELLEALQKLCPLTHLDTCKALRWGPVAREERERDCDCGAALARKAIAKATGGTP